MTQELFVFFVSIALIAIGLIGKEFIADGYHSGWDLFTFSGVFLLIIDLIVLFARYAMTLPATKL